MIVGQPTRFAIESRISKVSRNLSVRAIGLFVLHIDGYCYGIKNLDSTAIACSFDEVGRRIVSRGTHTAPFAAEPNAGLIADSVRNAIYADESRDSHFGIPAETFTDLIYSNHLLWAPDGDQAFDDGSYVLHFDEGDQVRLIGFKSAPSLSYNPNTLRDVWVDQNTFYNILKEWHAAFESEWSSMLNI